MIHNMGSDCLKTIMHKTWGVPFQDRGVVVGGGGGGATHHGKVRLQLSRNQREEEVRNTQQPDTTEQVVANTQQANTRTTIYIYRGRNGIG
jgi:hypothetical protein